MITPALNITATERVLPRLALDFTTGVVDSRITFSRGSIATVISSDGALKWAGHNLLSDSESFNASAWIKSSVTVGANSIAAPDGATTADTLTASGSNGTTLQAWTALGHPATFAVWLRRKTGTGTVEIAADSGTYTAVTITSNWALYTVTQTPAAGSRNAGIRIVTSGDEVYVWGAHLYYSNLGGMVLNPARNDTYYSTTVANLLSFTETFSTAYWSNLNTTTTTTSAVGPTGVTSTVLAYPSSSGATRVVWRSTPLTVVASTPYTISVYAKANGINFLYFGTYAGSATASECAFFDLQNGVRTQVGTGFTSATITSVGNGWYRCSAVATSAGTVLYPIIGLADANNSSTVTANGTDGIYIWGAQLSDSASLDPYVVQPIAAPANAPYYAPRLDYSPTSIGTPRGLLIEEQRTNIFLNSENLAAAFPGATNATIVNGSGFATLTDNSTSGTHLVNGNNLFAPDGVTRCWSIEFKGGTARYAIISHSDSFTSTLNTYIFDTQTGAWTATTTDTLYALAFFTPQNMGDGWWRVCFSSNLNSAFYDNFAIGISNGPNFADRSYSGTGSTILVRRPQIESGAFPTSYIPTTTTTAQRNADVVQMTGTNFSDWFNTSEGAFAAQYSRIAIKRFSRVFAASNVAESEQVTVGSGLQADGRENGNIKVAGVDAFLYPGNTLAANVVSRFCLSYKTGSSAASLNASAIASNAASFANPAPTQLNIGSIVSSGQYLNGHVQKLLYWPQALTNAEVQTFAKVG